MCKLTHPRFHRGPWDRRELACDVRPRASAWRKQPIIEGRGADPSRFRYRASAQRPLGGEPGRPPPTRGRGRNGCFVEIGPFYPKQEFVLRLFAHTARFRPRHGCKITEKIAGIRSNFESSVSFGFRGFQRFDIRNVFAPPDMPVRDHTGRMRSSDWRREGDSNPRYGFPYTHFPGVRLKPLGHLSASRPDCGSAAEAADAWLI